MNREPLVSVISVVHKASPFLSEAIESVLAQTYTNWELLLVNCDSRTDGAPSTRQYAAQRPDKIRYLEHSGQENRGMSASRNATGTRRTACIPQSR
jgi:glycosyltransferase involved in cell wall biosynthesis